MKDKRVTIIAFSLFLICSAERILHAQERYEPTFRVVAQEIKSIYHIAPSISTGIEARKAIAYFHWQQTQDPFDSDAVLVVVKTFALRWPLDSFYDNIEDLVDDAEGQMNITGEIIHLYLYSISPNGLHELAHMRYEEDY